MKMKYREPKYVELFSYNYEHKPKVPNAFGIELEFNSSVGHYIGVPTFDSSVRNGVEFKIWTGRPVKETFVRNLKKAMLKWICEIPDLRFSGTHIHFQSDKEKTLWYNFIRKYQRVFLSFFAERYKSPYVRKLFTFKSEFDYGAITNHYAWINCRNCLNAYKKHFEVRLMPSTLWWYNIIGWLKFWEKVDENLEILVNSQETLLDTLTEYCGPFLYEMVVKRDDIPILPKRKFEFISCDYNWCRKCKHLKLGNVCACSNVGIRSSGKKYVLYIFDQRLVHFFQDRYSTEEGNPCGIFRTNDPTEMYSVVSLLNYYSENVFSNINLNTIVFQMHESGLTREDFFTCVSEWENNRS